MSEWSDLALADVLQSVDERVAGQNIELVLSVTEKRGIVPQTEVFTKRVAVANVAKYKVLRSMDIAYNPYLLWTGAVGQWLGEEPGVTSPVYECFRTRSPHDPRFAGLLLESGLLRPYFDSTAVGSIQRRRRTTPQVFLAAEMSIPSPKTQRRIVDLIGALDLQIKSLAEEQEQAHGLLLRLLDNLWEAHLSDTQIAVGELAELGSGPSWAASDEVAATEAGAIPVLKITNTRPDGRIDLAERLYVRGLPTSTRLLDARSLIAIRTNGNRERIGNVYLPSVEVFGSAVSAFQFIVQAESSDLRDYLYWALRAPRCQRLMSDAASGSTGLGNMGAKWLRALAIPWPDTTIRTDFVDTATAMWSLVESLIFECESLRAVRTRCLVDLLTGVAEIDASYDNGLAEAV